MPRTAALDDIKRLYEAHAAEVRQVLARLAPGLDADDLLQEVFIVAIARADRLVAAASPRAWLFGLAIKLAATRARSARLRSFFGLEKAEHVPAVDAPSRTAEQRDAQKAVARALESLAPSKREAFVLFELQGLAGEEVAEALGIPLKTVWTRLHHARKEVTEALERQLLVEARTSGLTREEIRP